jgi:UDP-3-O-[3-hydroxymyristoyl] N-acetylglucosamine deacetylase
MNVDANANVSVTLRGRGLQRGELGSVRFVRADGPVRLRSSDGVARIDELVADGSGRTTVVRAGALDVGTVEHLFAALEARSIRSGLVIEIEGPEIPLVDGGARAFTDALAMMELPEGAPRRVVTRAETFEVGESRYAFRPASLVRVAVEIDFGDPRIAPHAEWFGDADEFREHIAPARTFGFARELEALADRGLRSHVSPTSVILFAEGAVHVAGRPYASDEPARHKLLDLLGDLYLHGGAPVGEIRAYRPGHAATHDVMRRALRLGVVT